MKARMKNFTPAIVLSVICLIATALLAIVNGITEDIIYENENAAVIASLKEVIPGGEFGSPEQLPTGAPKTVKAIYKEKNGKGYVVVVSTEKGYTGKPINFTVAFSQEGELIGAKVTSNPETKGTDLTNEYPSSLVGKTPDELADAPLVSGATVTSTAMRNAILDALFSIGFGDGETPAPEPEIGPSEEDVLAAAARIAPAAKNVEKIDVDTLPKTVKAAYKSEDGLFYVFSLVTETQYNPYDSGSVVVIDSDGKVIGLEILAWNVGHDVDYTDEFVEGFDGKTLENIDDVGLVTEATGTSGNIRAAVKDVLSAFKALTEVYGPTEDEAFATGNRLINGAAGFEAVELENAPKTIKALYKETSGKGYVAVLVTETQYNPYDSGSVVVIDNDGKVIGLEILAWNVGHDVDYTDEFVNSFAGKSLSDVETVSLVTGATGTSGNIRSAVKDALFAVESAKDAADPSDADVIEPSYEAPAYRWVGVAVLSIGIIAFVAVIVIRKKKGV